MATGAAGDISGTLTLTSDYRFRALSQDARAITPQAELDWNGPDGWSLGAFASKVDFQDHENTSLEVDAFGGKHIDIGNASLDLNAFYYAYPNHHPGPGSPRYSTFETNAKLSRQLGGLTASVSLSWSPDFLANGESWDAEIGLSRNILPWLSVGGHLGRQWEARWNSDSSSGFPYAYGDLGLSAATGPWSFDLRYAASSLSKSQCLTAVGGRHWCESGAILTLSYALSATQEL